MLHPFLLFAGRPWRSFAIAMLILFSAHLAPTSANAAPIQFTDLDSYNTAVGAHHIVDFQGLSHGTILTNQLAGQGLTFSDGSDRVVSDPSFFQDHRGFRDLGASTLLFSTPQNHFGIEFPGGATVQLYDGLSLVFSGNFGGLGTRFFAGVVLDLGTTYDRVVLSDFFDGQGFYDNLHFSSVPEPGTASLLAVGLASLASRRRRS